MDPALEKHLITQVATLAVLNVVLEDFAGRDIPASVSEAIDELRQHVKATVDLLHATLGDDATWH